MCGIAGLLLPPGQRPSEPLLQLMARRLHHRGPDGSGVLVDGPCGLVHTRLAILDPERGKQPMKSPFARRWISFNGEIYNSPELRRRLEARGHQFRTTTDTEVILTLSLDEPEHFVERLEGIFAFAIWDGETRELTLARDYLGVKPLYLFEDSEGVVFASEVKALLADPRVPCEPDPRGLMEILAFQNTYHGRTCFRDIRLLEGGEILRVRPGGGPRSRRFWTFSPPTNRSPGDYEHTAETTRELCEQVIRDQLLSDVPVASYLSGGMDTGLLTAVAARDSENWQTFSGGFLLDGVPPEFHGHDERDAARLMSGLFGTQHRFTEIRPEMLVESFGKIAWHLEEPRGSTCYAPWTMAEHVGANVKVVLSGHGGDELFAGYRARYELARDHAGDWEPYWFTVLNHLVPHTESRNWLHPDFADGTLPNWPRDVYHEFVKTSRGLSPQSRAQHHDLFVYMHGLLLIEDKLSMAHALESRVPLLDRRLFEHAWSLPDAWKLGPQRGKQILRDGFRGRLPQEILQRDKMGFGPPDDHYYRTQLRGVFDELLLGGSFAQRGILRPGVIENLVQRQRRGEPLAGFLWTMASIEMWYRTFIDRERELRFGNGGEDVRPVDLPVTMTVAEMDRRSHRVDGSHSRKTLLGQHIRRGAAGMWRTCRRISHSAKNAVRSFFS